MNAFEEFGREVAKLVARNPWGEFDTDEIAEIGEKCGVVQRVPFDRVKHADIEGAEDMENGDTVLEWRL